MANATETKYRVTEPFYTDDGDKISSGQLVSVVDVTDKGVIFKTAYGLEFHVEFDLADQYVSKTAEIA